MATTYTDSDAIARRLRGRLKLSGAQAPYGETVAETDLVTQLCLQVEAKVNAVLRESYSFPLKAATATNELSRPILAGLVEKGVICELMRVHNFAPEEGHQYGLDTCRSFEQELKNLAEGNPRLPGETLLQPNELGSDYSRAGARTAGTVETIADCF